MFKILFQHMWKGMVRSILWHRNLGVNIFFGIILFLLGLNLLSIGLYIDLIFKEVLPGVRPVSAFNRFLLYYLIIDLILRILLQKIPELEIQSYLLLPVSRKKIANFLIFRSLFTVFNILPFLIFIPFALKIVLPAHQIVSTVCWLVAIGFLLLSNTLFHFYMEKLQFLKIRRVVVFLLFLIIFLTLDKMDLVNFQKLSQIYFAWFLEKSWTLVFPIILSGILYLLNFNLLRRYLYPDRPEQGLSFSSSDTTYLDHLKPMGKYGEYLVLELKMLLRNKRTRSTSILTPVMLIISPFFYLTITDQFNFYPVPEQVTPLYVQTQDKMNGECLVTFIVHPGSKPSLSHIYITGDHARLGNWKPGFLPLVQVEDSTWIRSIAFEKGTRIRYIFTLGSWENEAKLADGEKPDVREVTITSDTTMTYIQPNWKTAKRLLFTDIMIIYMGILLTGILMMSYGQFIFAWEGNYFDLLLVRPVNFYFYLRAKYYLSIVFSLIIFLVVLPTFFIQREIFYMNAALFTYNLGVNSLVTLSWASLSRKRVDLNASIFSTQGKGSSQYLILIPFLFVPIFFYLPFAVLNYPTTGFIFLAGLGILGLVFNRAGITLALTLVNRQKYKMAAGFRQR